MSSGHRTETRRWTRTTRTRTHSDAVMRGSFGFVLSGAATRPGVFFVGGGERVRDWVRVVVTGA